MAYFRSIVRNRSYEWLIVALTWSCFTNAAHAQATFTHIYDLPGDVTVSCAARMPDGGLVLAGQTVDATEGLLMRVDIQGDVQWIRQYPAIGPNGAGTLNSVVYDQTTYRDVVVDPAGRVQIAGSSSSTEDLYGSEFLVSHVDANGDSLWGRVGGSIYSDWFDAIAQEQSGTLLVGGHGGSLGGGRGMLGRMDPQNGTMLIEMAWLPLEPVAPSVNHIVPTSDGGAMVAGEVGNLVALARFDQGLQVVWDTLLLFPGAELVEARGLAQAPDGSMIALISTWATVQDHAFVLMNWDPAGQLVWADLVDDATFSLNATDVTALVDGRIVVAGGGGVDPTAFIMRFDADGDVEFAQRLDDGAPSIEVTAMVANPVDGSCYLVGNTVDNDPVLIRLDAGGSTGDCAFDALTPSITPASFTAQPDPAAPFPWSVSDLAPLTNLPYPVYAGGNLICAGDPSPYRASGSIFFDADSDGLFDPGEPGLPQATVQVQPASGWLFTIGDSTYTFIAPDSGTYVLSDLAPGPWWELSSDSASYTITFTGTDTAFGDLDFGWVPSMDTTVLSGSYASGGLRCDNDITQWIHVLNQGTTNPAGVVSLTLDSLLEFVSADPPPDSIVGPTVYWHFAALGFFQWWSTSLVVHTPDASFADDTVQSTLQLWAEEAGGLVLIDETVREGVVTCSLDPNDKSVSPVGEGPYGGIPPGTEWLDYTVRFQNTGNDTAFVVTILDQLSPNLRWNSMQVLGTSHDLTSVSVNSSGQASFVFDNIQLPDSGTNELASHGFVTFRIALQPGLEHLTAISNNVGIVFDQNTPVITNTVINTIVDCTQAQLPLTLSDDGSGGLFAYTYFMDTTPYGIQWLQEGLTIPGATGWSYQATTNGFYSVELTDPYGCRFISNEVQVVLTNVVASSAGVMSVMPNPFSESARILFTSSVANDSPVRLINVFGQTVRSWRTDGSRELVIERGSLPAGPYFIRATTVEGKPLLGRLLIDR